MDISGIDKNYSNLKARQLFEKASDGAFEKVLKDAARKEDDEKLRKACMDFEAIFLRMMYKQMRQSIPKSGLIPESFSSETFEDMFDEKVVDEIVKGRGIGLGESLYRTLKRQMKADEVAEEEGRDGQKAD